MFFTKIIMRKRNCVRSVSQGKEEIGMYRVNGKQVNLEYREYQFSSDFPLFTLLLGEFRFPKPSTELDFMHFHNCVEIGICRSGKQILYVEDQVMEMEEGDICIIPPYAMHITQALPSYEEELFCEYIYFLPETILSGVGIHQCPQNLRWYSAMGVGRVFSKKEGNVYSIVNGILEEMRKNDHYSRSAVYGYLQMLYVLLSRNSYGEEWKIDINYYEREQLFPAISYVNNRFSEPILISDLASMCNMTGVCFHNLFAKQMGKSPMAYVRFIRLQHACELLTGTEKKIIDISMECGFSSVSNFNRCFLQQYHKTPRQWRNETRTIKKIGVNHTTYRHHLEETVFRKGRKEK